MMRGTRPVRRSRRRAALAAVPAGILLLAGCGGGSSATTTPAASPTGSAAAGGTFRNSAQFQQIQQCLQAAGITLPTPSGTFSRGPRPSGSFSPRPRPTGSGGTDERRGGFGGGMFNDPKVQAALKACGITLPTGGFGRGPGATPTGAPSA